MTTEENKMTPEEAEDIFAARFARILVDQVLEQNQKKEN